ncbi:MAG: ABC transporter permease [Acidobacteria bacterium]|nr:ABC transporter permease [Acidobacteriota bacterium]
MFVGDLVYAARGLGRNLGFSLTAVVTIALGIGACTALFSVVNAVLLRPLPYTKPERLGFICTDLRNRNVLDFPTAPGDLYDLRLQGTMFEGIAALTTGRQTIADENLPAEQIIRADVTTNLFQLLGAQIALGRDFVEEDGTPPTPQEAGQAGQAAQPALPVIAILSHEFWQSRFGGDRGVLGRSIDLSGGRLQVIGVLAPGFELLFPPGINIERSPAIYSAMRRDFATGSRQNVSIRLIGRLRDGVAFNQAQAQLDSISAELRKRFPVKESAGTQFRLEQMHEDLIADVRPAILALMGAVVFVLLIACANVANLLLVRASERERELAVRSALGGNRWQLVRQMMAESLLLAGGGALLGLILAKFGINLLLLIRPANLPRIESIGIDPLVLAFTAFATIAATAIFGIIPALRASRPNLLETLRMGGRTLAPGAGGLLRNGVVIAEVALSFVLLIGCGLMLRSFIALQRTDPGYDPNGVLTFFLPNTRASGEEGRRAFIRELHTRLSALPGVQSVTAASPLPLDGLIGTGRYGTDAALADPRAFQQANVHFVLPGYFETLRTKIIEGRTFTDADNNQDARVIVIDRILAAKAFPNQSAVGKRLFARIRTEVPETFEVIGVVAHQRHTTLSIDGREAMFFTDGLMGSGITARWAIRTAMDPLLLAPAVRAEIARLNPQLAIAEVQPMRAFVVRAQGQTRFALALIGVFAGIAALLAAVGLYGVLSTLVRQRTVEIGVRMVFGAQPGNIFRLIIGRGLRLSVTGIALGLLAAIGLTHVMSGMLVEVKPTDPSTFAAIATLFILIAVIASWLPARRAARLDPNIAIREE